MAHPHTIVGPDTSASRLIVLMGAKGGVGTTTIATNLAVAIRRTTQSFVTFLDWDWSSNDAAQWLNVRPENTLRNLLLAASEPDLYFLSLVLAQSPTGVAVLANGFTAWEPRVYSEQRLDRTVELAIASAPVVVADVGKGTGQEILPVIKRATRVVVVVHTDLGAMTRAARLFEWLTAAGVPQEHQHLLANSVDGTQRHLLREAVASLGRELLGEVPDDPTSVVDAFEAGEALVQRAPRSPVALAVQTLADRLLPGPSTRGRTGRCESVARLRDWITRRLAI